MAQTAKPLPHIPKRSFSTTYRLTQKNVANFYLHALLPTLVAWGALFAAGIVLICFRTTRMLGILVAILVAAYCLYRFLRVRKNYKASLKDPDLFREIELKLDEVGFTAAPVGTPAPAEADAKKAAPQVAWLYMVGVQTIGQLYAFRVRPQQTMLVPKSAFDGEQRAWIERCVIPYVKKSDKILAEERKKKK